jgi:hypothetical protein
MDHYRSWPDNSLVHHDWHAGRVRIVPREEAEAAKAEMRTLFTHEPVLSVPLGCPHVCLYTDSAPASIVEERIVDHLTRVEHRRFR